MAIASASPERIAVEVARTAVHYAIDWYRDHFDGCRLAVAVEACTECDGRLLVVVGAARALTALEAAMRASAVYLVHDDRAESAEEACIPRVSLDCAACHASVVYCHLASDVLRLYVDPKTPPWRCSSCGGAT